MKTSKGFTIIELIITIVILAVAIIGVYNAFSIITILTSDSSDRLTATYLSQEGIEIARNIRDKNWLNMDDCSADPDCDPGTYNWTDGLIIGPKSGTIGCSGDYTSKNLIGYINSNYLCINSAGFYYQSIGSCTTPTKFKRKITVNAVKDTNGDSNHIMKVKVEVSWDKKATLLNPGLQAGNCTAYNCVTTEETLYDWYYPNH